MIERRRTRVSHEEYEAVRENCLVEIILSARITKAMNMMTVKDESHPTQEGKRSKGTGVGASCGKGAREKCWGPRVNTYHSSRYWQRPKGSI